MVEFLFLDASLACDVVLTGQENAVPFVESAEGALIVFFFLCFTVRLGQLALVGEAAA